MEKTFKLIVLPILYILPFLAIFVIVFELGGSLLSLQDYLYWWLAIIWSYLVWLYKIQVKLSLKIAIALFLVGVLLTISTAYGYGEFSMRVSLIFFTIAIIQCLVLSRGKFSG